jgi:hypothetical protein
LSTICSKENKKWAALPLINTYFSLFPNSQVKKKEKKREKVCGQASFISDMKLYTISLQNPNKKTHL